MYYTMMYTKAKVQYDVNSWIDRDDATKIEVTKWMLLAIIMLLYTMPFVKKKSIITEQ